MEEINLSEFVQDALREIGNIGASHAANSLSDSTKIAIDMKDLKVENLKAEAFSKLLEDQELIASIFSLTGSVSGRILLFFPIDAATKIAKMLGEPKTLKDVDDLIQKISAKMTRAFANSMGDFFNSEVGFEPDELDEEKIQSFKDLLKALDLMGEAVFFDATLITSAQDTVCKLYMSLNDDDVGRMMGLEIPDFAGEGMTFQDMLGSFEEIKEIENEISRYLQVIEVPRDVKRDFLRATENEEFDSSILKIFLENILKELGIGGNIRLEKTEPLKYSFYVGDCKICDMVESKGVPSCHTTTTALGRIFMESLRIGNSVEETECAQLGSESCVHVVSLEQIDVFSVLSTKEDIEILRAMKEGNADVRSLSKSTSLPEGEVTKILRVLKDYNIIDEANGKFRVSDLGVVYLTFAENAPQIKEEIGKDWYDIRVLNKKASKIEGPSEEDAGEVPWA